MRDQVEATGISRAIYALIFAIILAVCWPAERADAAGAVRTVRVGYPIQSGLTDLDEYGNYFGYTYDYLEEIAQYTGWDFEFVRVAGTQAEQMSELSEMLRNGEIDLLGSSFYTEELDEKFVFSSHSYGVLQSVLTAPADGQHNIVINSQVMQKLRIAVYKAEENTLRGLFDYCDANMIEPEIIECSSEEGKLRAVQEGRADVMLSGSMDREKGVQEIARFSPRPFYFMLSEKSVPGLLHELDSAIVDIQAADPAYSAMLYQKYFSLPADELTLSADEMEYVRASESVRAGILTGLPPYQYQDEEGMLAGIGVDMLKLISEKTGLRIEMVPVKGADELNRLLENGELDLISGTTRNYEAAMDKKMSLSRPYVSSQYILMTTEESSGQDVVGKRLALPVDSNYENMAVGTVVHYADALECIMAVSSHEADYTYVDACTAQYYVNLPEYESLKLIPQTFEPRQVCFGLAKPADRELLNIINKTLAVLTEEEEQSIINKNTLIPRKAPLSRAVRNILFGLTATLFFTGVIFAVYYISKKRNVRLLIEAREKADEARRSAETASRAKSVFLSRMSHEIRTPLNGIVGMSEIAIRNSRDEERVKDCLQKVLLSSSHLLSLVNDVLDMSKIENGKIEPARETFDFFEFLNGVTSIYTSQAAQKGVSFQSVLNGPVEKRLIGDKLRLTQVLGNLISNACKYTPSGGKICLTAEQLSDKNGEAELRFTVSDTGCGIAPENLDRIFSSFEQESVEKAIKYGGTGLGLSIAKRFTELLGGSISVTSEPEKGSVFTVLLPFGIAEEEDSGQKERVSAGMDAPCGEEKDLFDFTGFRILLAEDNMLNREIALELIGATGALMETACDGQEALEMFTQSPEGYFDLILMDIQMPRMNGYETAREIRGLTRRDAADIPIIAMTADAFAEDEIKCLAAGMNAHISKPIDVRTTYHKIAEFLKRDRPGI